MLGVAYLTLVAELLWCALWTLAALGVYAHVAGGKERRQGGGGGGHGEHVGLVVFLAVALYWGQQVRAYVRACVRGGRAWGALF